MALRRRTIRRMSPVARKLAKLANEAQSTMRKLKYLIGEVQELEWAVKANNFKGSNEEDVFDVQPEDTGGSNTAYIPRGKGSRYRYDHLGEPTDRRKAAAASRARRRQSHETEKGEKRS